MCIIHKECIYIYVLISRSVVFSLHPIVHKGSIKQLFTNCKCEINFLFFNMK